jgi:hypothetical protein
MNRLMIACFTVAGICSLSATASAATPNTTPAAPIAGTATDTPHALAKLRGEVRTLQIEAQSLENQYPAGTEYLFSTGPSPAPDGSPITSGG